jgi:antitoxin YefM
MSPTCPRSRAHVNPSMSETAVFSMPPGGARHWDRSRPSECDRKLRRQQAPTDRRAGALGCKASELGVPLITLARDDDRASHSAAAERSLRRPKRKRSLAAARRLELASPAVSLSNTGASVTDQPRVSEMIRVGEEAPPGRDRKQVICRQRVASNIPVDIQRVPAHGREGRPLTKLMGVDCDWRKADVAGIAIRVHDRREVTAHRLAVSQMDWHPLADRQERAETQLGNACHVVRRVPTGVLVYERLDGGGQPARLSQTSRVRSTSRDACVPASLTCEHLQPRDSGALLWTTSMRLARARRRDCLAQRSERGGQRASRAFVDTAGVLAIPPGPHPPSREPTARKLCTRSCPPYPMVKKVPVGEFRRNLSRLLRDVADRRDHVLVSRYGRSAARLVPVDEYEALEETVEILSDPDTLAALEAGLAELERGETVSVGELRRELDERRPRP